MTLSSVVYEYERIHMATLLNNVHGDNISIFDWWHFPITLFLLLAKTNQTSQPKKIHQTTEEIVIEELEIEPYMLRLVMSCIWKFTVKLYNNRWFLGN